MVADLVRGTHGALVGGRLDTAITGVSIDSRTVRPGEAFVAIRGARLDGHDFVEQALSRGAAAAVVSALPTGLALPSAVAFVLVGDTTEALQHLALFHRRRFTLPVVAVTGSNGKTTTKELIALVLGRRRRVLHSRGSYNNQWGLPLTLLELGATHQAAVVELGMSALGEIAALARIAQPTIGVLTTIAPAHIEFLGSVEGVQQAKGELVLAIPLDGVVILNADDPLVLALARHARGRVLTYGSAADADVRIEDVVAEDAALTFSVAVAGQTARVRLPLAGRHNAWNAAAAIAVAHVLGVSLADAAEALASAAPVKGRLHWREAAGVLILDDTYNANPASLRAALDVLAARRGAGRAFVVLADMLELGPSSERLHREAGGWVAALPAAGLVTVGPAARHAALAARAAGCPDVDSADSPEEAALALSGRARAGDRILVKGSRGMRMERAVATLIARLEGGEGRC